MLKKEEQNSVVLSDTVPLSSSPGCAAGERRIFSFLFYCFFSLSLHASSKT
jgi:hypothetical protein